MVRGLVWELAAFLREKRRFRPFGGRFRTVAGGLQTPIPVQFLVSARRFFRRIPRPHPTIRSGTSYHRSQMCRVLTCDVRHVVLAFGRFSIVVCRSLSAARGGGTVCCVGRLVSARRLFILFFYSYFSRIPHRNAVYVRVALVIFVCVFGFFFSCSGVFHKSLFR